MENGSGRPVEHVPLAAVESYHSNLGQQGEAAEKEALEDGEKHDFVGNDIEIDRIPYMSIYDEKEEVRRRGYFIPGYPVTAAITAVEKRRGRMSKLVNPHLYTIDLQHGQHKWTIKRHYGDFQKLNNSLKLYRLGAQLVSPFHRGLDETVLQYSDGGRLIEMADEVTSIVAAMPAAETAKTAEPEEAPLLAKGQGPKGPETTQDRKPSASEAIPNKTISNARRRQMLDQALPDFPTTPEVFVSEAKLEQRRRELEQFLQAVLKVRAYRDHPETAQFLEVSRLSFVHNVGPKEKEGKVERRPNRCIWLRKLLGPDAHKCCMVNCVNWREAWLVLKDNYVALVDLKKEIICDVMIFDKNFDVYTQPEYPGDRREAVRNGLFITNGVRYLMLQCSSAEEAIQWKTDIENVTMTKGSTWSEEHRFGSSYPIRQGVYAQWLVDGSAFFEHVANILELAKEEIFISNWLMNARVYMKRPMMDDRWRLDMILKRKAEEGVRVFVLLYNEVAGIVSLFGSARTEKYLHGLSPKIKVLRHPDILEVIIPYWTHHEKVVIVDQKVAFVGGIDLCFGRWDDYHHRLTDLGAVKADPSLPDQLESEQNETVAAMKRLYAEQSSPMTSRKMLKDEPSIDDIMHMKYARIKGHKSRARTVDVPPRFDESGRLWPGKDYQNALLKDPLGQNDKDLEDMIDRTVVPRLPWHDIGCVVYGSVARDAARHFIERWNASKVEYVHDDSSYPFLIPKSHENVAVPEIFQNMSIPCNAQVLRSSTKWSTGRLTTEDSIYKAYMKLIEEAKHYIYIENQFMVSNTSGPDVHNKLTEAVYNRIVKAHERGETFRVYVVMPLLPGFLKSSGAMQMGLHYAYTTISKGPSSLLYRLRETVGDPSRYIFFCSLRTHAELLGRLVTESVYVHSKMMIVDDQRCLIGSANINDRSLLGARDSECVMYIEDTEFTESVMNGQPYQAGKFASSFRKHLFKEYLALMDTTSDLEVDLTDPVSDTFFGFWKDLAVRNTQIYEAVFACTPCDDVKTLAQWAQKEQTTVPLADSDKEKALGILKEVRGFLVTFPTKFLSDSDLLAEKFVVELVAPTVIFT